MTFVSSAHAPLGFADRPRTTKTKLRSSQVFLGHFAATLFRVSAGPLKVKIQVSELKCFIVLNKIECSYRDVATARYLAILLLPLELFLHDFVIPA